MSVGAGRSKAHARRHKGHAIAGQFLSQRCRWKQELPDTDRHGRVSGGDRRRALLRGAYFLTASCAERIERQATGCESYQVLWLDRAHCGRRREPDRSVRAPRGQVRQEVDREKRSTVRRHAVGEEPTSAGQRCRVGQRIRQNAGDSPHRGDMQGNCLADRTRMARKRNSQYRRCPSLLRVWHSYRPSDNIAASPLLASQ